MLQKSKVAGLKIFHENTKQRAIIGSFDLNRVTDSPVNFALGSEVPHILYTKDAPAARRTLVICENRLLQQYRP
jgi:hypothetical protein